jgi:hypothetical protein
VDPDAVLPGHGAVAGLLKELLSAPGDGGIRRSTAELVIP